MKETASLDGSKFAIWAQFVVFNPWMKTSEVSNSLKVSHSVVFMLPMNTEDLKI